jgi:hypothetical protein
MSDAVHYANSIDLLYNRVHLCIRRDFDLPQDAPVDSVGVVCFGRDVDLSDLQRQLGFHGVYRIRPDVAGLYVPAFSLAIVPNYESQREFEQNLAHELCHALCDQLLGSHGQVLWAYEAYAYYVTDCVVPNEEESAATLRGRRCCIHESTNHVFSLAELLVRQYVEPGAQEEEFHSLATLFLSFLMWLSDQGYPQLWGIFRGELASCATSPGKLVGRIENAVGESAQKIEERFLAYAARIADRGGSVWPVGWTDKVDR